ncbi:MAG: RNA-binding transcriptional accessory protein [Oscillospiraceae bacterium]|nr:RNA-binding transcriptional accessory protein [Oscillospiraceae bacterium]
MDINKQLCEEFHLKQHQVDNAVKLMDDGNTIPFIARYRKEMTGSLDDQILRELFDRLTYLRGLEKRKEEVISSITEQEKMTDEIMEALSKAKTLAEVEDIYRPYKPKRKTRASVAKEKGLEPLANKILEQDKNNPAPIEMAGEFIDEEKGVTTAEEALAGAMDIIAENISDDARLRKLLRELMRRTGELTTKATDAEAESVYTMYYDYHEPVFKVAGHRVLAIDRGEKEDFLKVSIDINREECLTKINELWLKEDCSATETIKLAGADAFDRLIFPSLEREIRSMLTETAAEAAIKVFAENLKNLLMQAPIKNMVTLGFDPGFRTGCKVAVVDATGKVLDTGVVYPTPPHNKIAEAKKIISSLVLKHGVNVIAIGNGTASRESEQFIAGLIKELSAQVSYVIVSEAGASVYSASKLAATEFPDYDVSLRSAVSIARRLQDPLAELVKIDPKAIGVGQYQHDMPKNRMDEALGGVVEGCVNSVGVDLNTASQSLLSHIAGVNSAVAKNIVLYREENGAFKSRAELLKVAKLGKKAYEQCAGFLRVAESKNVLDNTGVHPESYDATKKLLSILSYTLDDVKNGNIKDMAKRLDEYGIIKAVEETGVGEPTLRDIVKELLKPGRDPRDELPKPILRSDVLDMEHLSIGMELMGTVRNVIDFGAFVDIGVHEDGLVHISQICDKYIKHPSEILKVGDIVKVKVIDVDLKRKRIALTMKGVSKEQSAG